MIYLAACDQYLNKCYRKSLLSRACLSLSEARYLEEFASSPFTLVFPYHVELSPHYHRELAVNGYDKVRHSSDLKE